MTQFSTRNISMMMDLYEMTMANGYFAHHETQPRVIFDIFYRKNPDEGGFAIFAGLEQMIEYVENMHFTEEDIAYFESLNLFSGEFLAYLKDFHFSGDIYAFPEGTVMYPNEPCVTVVAPLIDAQLVETALLALVNHQPYRPGGRWQGRVGFWRPQGTQHGCCRIRCPGGVYCRGCRHGNGAGGTEVQHPCQRYHGTQLGDVLSG